MPELHRPVLCQEVVRLLDPQPGKIYVDGTVGLGGHAEALLREEPAITLVGIDLDPEALSFAAERLSDFGNRVHLIHGNYRDLARHLIAIGIQKIAGFSLDLGVSSLQFDEARRGFSFRRDGPLDMRMDPTWGETAAQFVNTASEDALSEILLRYGEERFAKRIARTIVQERVKTPVETTERLANIVREAIPRRFHPKAIDPATRTFQALRIVINQELENLDRGLEEGFQCLECEGTLVAISFHSLEDRLVKRFLRHKALSCTCPPDLPECVCDKQVEVKILTPKPIRPSEEEIAQNPRARSARLRAARKII